jgi:flagellar basal body-associated protein FliL
MKKKKSIKSQLIMICMSIVIFAAAVLTIVAILCINSQSSMTSKEYNQSKRQWLRD